MAKGFASSFADLELLRVLPGSGGPELLRARRILAEGTGPRLHVSFFGTARPALATRIVEVADAVGRSVHDGVGRIYEVGAHEGALYAIAEPLEGVPLGALLERHRARRTTPDMLLCVAVALQLADIANELHDRSDVWDAESGAGLSSLFPAGMRLDAVVILADGSVAVRPIACAGYDPARPSAFRAPELVKRTAAAASDVFLVAQTLRALLSGDAAATSAPRFGPQAAALGPLMLAGLNPNPDERVGLFMLLERLQKTMSDASTTPRQVLAAAIRDEEELAVAAAGDPPPGADASAVRARLSSVRSALEVLWPRRASASPPALLELPEGETAVLTRGGFGGPSTGSSPSAVGRVFTEEGHAAGLELPFSVDLSVDLSGFGDSETEPETKEVPMPRVARAAPVLDAAAAAATFQDEATTQTRTERPPMDVTEESEPPWLTGSDEVQIVEARGAPAVSPSEIEAGPTVEMRPPAFADDDDDGKTEA